MPSVRISATRFRSLLANRNLTPADVAERTTITLDPQDLIESDLDVEFEDILALAKLIKRPWSYLLLDDAEAFPSAGQDNRTFDNRKAALSPDLLLELQAAEFMLTAAAELFPDSSFHVPDSLGSDPTADRLGDALRSLLDVSIDDQLAVKNEFAALRLWVAAIHAQGVYVSQRRLKDESIRAFSRILGDQALVVVDTGDPPYARIFSALHEYAHVTLRSTGICDLDDHSAVERYCNAVAARVLLPPGILDEVVVPGLFSGDEAEADEALKRLSRQLHVSQAVLLIALRDRHSITQETYEGMEARRRARRKGGRQKSGGQYYPTAINKVGRLFAHRVVDAVSEGVIDRQDASVLLGVGEHNVGRFTSALAKGD